MPGRIKLPDPDSLLGTHACGAHLYAMDAREEYPLYRNLKVIAPRPLWDARRTAHLTWIVHRNSLRRGGDSHLLAQRTELSPWIVEICREVFDSQYILDTFGLTAVELTALIVAEENKYR